MNNLREFEAARKQLREHLDQSPQCENENICSDRPMCATCVRLTIAIIKLSME